MRDLFPGYFQLTEEEVAEIFHKGLFVLDTNVLLNFYRYTPQTSTDFFRLFEQLGERLWVPNRVMEEFLRNRKRVIQAQDKIFEDIEKIYQRTVDSIGALLIRGHLSIDLDLVEHTSLALIDGLLEQVKSYKKQHPDLLSHDVIQESVMKLLNGKVGLPYETEKLAEIFVKAEQRYQAKVPPGYKDTETKKIEKGDNRYGDVLVWFQIIDKAKTAKKDIVFVTDEKKEDWWWIEEDGELIGPRPELVRELKKYARVRLFMCSPRSLLDLTEKYLGIMLEQKAVSEIQQVEDISLGWKDEITRAFKALGGQSSWGQLYEYIKKSTTRKLPDNWQAVIRYTVFAHSSDSEAFQGGEDLYARIERGKWGLRANNI